MKKLFLTVAIALGVFTAVNAQEAGRIWAGGVVSFGSTKTNDNDRKTEFQVLPEFGYFLTDNLGVGVAIGGGHRTYGESQSQNYYKVNPFLRYTFLKGDIGGLFVDGGATYGWNKVTNGGDHGHEWQVGFKPGVTVNVSNNISLIGKFGFLGYDYNKTGAKVSNGTKLVDEKTDKFGFNFDMNNIELGMNIKF